MTLQPATTAFYESDWRNGLFPLETTAVLLHSGAERFDSLIYGEILAHEDEPNFQKQERVYADKSGNHLRRTIKLDPVADVFLYDLVYRNRRTMPRDEIVGRKAYGFHFRAGSAMQAGAAYRDFRRDVRTTAASFKYSLECDVAAYFNSIYHHDLEHFYRELWSHDDAANLGLFLRLVNGGRSVDCLPQGSMPAKMLGHHFLRFIDYSGELHSERILRFMDDIVLFSESQQTLEDDFIVLQQLLGEKSLNINPWKTQIGYAEDVHLGRDIDSVRVQLLILRRERIGGYDDNEDDWYEDDDDEEEGGAEEDNDGNGAEEEDADNDAQRLTGLQLEYLQGLLSKDDVEDHDAELILDLMHGYPGTVMEHVPKFLERFPNLSRSLHRFCAGITNKEELGDIVLEFVRTSRRLSEYQLFWLVRIARDYLSGMTGYGEVLHALYSHASATKVSRAAVLEIPERRWGLPELRRKHLRGDSDWCAWAAAVGCRNEQKAARNYLMTYIANSGPINRLIADCVRGM